jgi:hypothetical protein
MNKDLSPIQQELLSRADSIFQSISATASKAYDVAADQLPDLAVQYIMYGRAMSIVATISVLLCVVVGAWAIYKWTEVSEGVIIIPVTVINGISLLIYLFNAPSFVMVWAAPKIWLIQEIIKLVK